MIANHTKLLPNLIATFLFMLPVFILQFFGESWAIPFYMGILVFVLVSSISNIRWGYEINKKDYSMDDRVYFVGNNRASAKLAKPDKRYNEQ